MPEAPSEADASAETAVLRRARDAGDPVRQQYAVDAVAQRMFGSEDVGVSVARYRLLDRLGSGATGDVYRARDPELEREVAVKVLRMRSEGDWAALLVREAKVLASLSHPNVVAVYDVGTFDARVLSPAAPGSESTGAFIVMELVQGPTLAAWLTREKRGWREIAGVFLQAGRGLAAAHRVGIVHHDFKPANVIIDRRGRARVVDFGLAWRVAEHCATGLSLDGGTPAYMAPEQHEGRRGDARSDQFGFAAALWGALYERRPYPGQGLEELAASKRAGPPREARPRGAPARLHRAILRALEPDPRHRFPTMEPLLAVMERCLGRRQFAWLAVPASLIVGASLALAARAPAGSPAALDCGDDDGGFETVWSAAQRERVHRAFVDTDLSYAGDSWARVEHRMTELGSAWRQTYATTCAQPEPDAGTLRCLENHRTLLAVILASLESGGTQTVSRAVETLATVPSASACLEEAPSAPGLDPPREGEAMQRAWTLRTLGRYPEALTVTEEALAGALDGVTHLRWLYLRGTILAAHGDLKEARQALTEAWLEAEQLQHASLSTATLAELVGVLANLGELESAREKLALGRTRLRTSGTPPELEVRMERAAGLVHSTRGRHEEALAAFERAHAVASAGGDRLAFQGLRVAVAIADQLDRLGRHADAARRLEALLEEQGTVLGEGHPAVGYLHLNLGAARSNLGDLPRAAIHNETAAEIFAESFAMEHEGRLLAVLNAAKVRIMMGHGPRALALALEAAETIAHHRGRDHVLSAEAESTVVGALMQLGRPGEARPRAEAAVEALRRTKVEDDARLSTALQRLGTIELQLGVASGAERLAETVDTHCEAPVALARYHCARALRQLVWASHRAGRVEDVRKALNRLGPLHGPEPPSDMIEAAVRVSVAEAMLEGGQPARALEAATALLAHLDADPDRPRPYFLASTLLVAGRAARRTGDAETAIAHAHRALEAIDRGKIEALVWPSAHLLLAAATRERDPKRAAAHLQQAEAAFARLGTEPIVQVSRHDEMAGAGPVRSGRGRQVPARWKR